MDKGVFPGQGTLTHSAHTIAPHSLSAPPLIMHGHGIATSRSQYRGASLKVLLLRCLHLDVRLPEVAIPSLCMMRGGADRLINIRGTKRFF